MTEGRYRNLNTKFLPAAGILLALSILGGVVLFGNLYLRAQIRQQIARAQAKVLYALWLSQESKLETSDVLGLMSEDPADQLQAVVETSQLQQLKGLLVTRLFDGKGKFIIPIPPASASTDDISPKDFALLTNLQPVSHFRPSARLFDLFPLESSLLDSAQIPLLEISIPLHSPSQSRLLGIAQFVLDGTSIAAEFDALDQRLISVASVVFLVGGVIVGIGLRWAFRRLQHANSLLSDRTRSLLHANQELALAAKTSAVGAVTAHLIHGLKNPLSGLQQFVANRSSEPSGGSDTEWQVAVSTTRRMQSLISDVVRVLREEGGVSGYEISVKELADVISAHVSPLTQQAGIHWQTRITAEGMFTNRDANLIILILENLIHNAIQATPKGKSVTLEIAPKDETIVCQVEDQGPGLSADARELLFKPCQSSKEGGSGIGLTISKQLATCIGAELELACNESGHCIFALTLPASVVSNATQSAISN
jgi:signal transduction histidine kinase